MFLDITLSVSLSSKEFGNNREFQAEHFLKAQKLRQSECLLLQCVSRKGKVEDPSCIVNPPSVCFLLSNQFVNKGFKKKNKTERPLVVFQLTMEPEGEPD